MMSRDITEVIDDYCRDKYGHTNWAWIDSLGEVMREFEQSIKEGETIGDIEGNIMFYYEENNDE